MSNLIIYIDALKHQENVFFQEKLSPDFLDISEKELIFDQQVDLFAKAYLSNDYLIICFSAKTIFQMPCRICSKNISLPLSIENEYKTIILENIKGGIYDFKEDLREELLIKLPFFVECNLGNCKERTSLEKYIKKPSNKVDDNYFPFDKIL